MTQTNRISGNLDPQVLATSYYALLGLSPSATATEIRQAYRELSKRYHPDTTQLPPAIATVKFQQLNEAYATLNQPEQRSLYDQKLGLTSPPRLYTIPTPPVATPTPPRRKTFLEKTGWLDPAERPLSPGEIFALFILGLTFVGCLVLAIAIGVTRGDIALHPIPAPLPPAAVETIVETPPQPTPSPEVTPKPAPPILTKNRIEELQPTKVEEPQPILTPEPPAPVTPIAPIAPIKAEEKPAPEVPQAEAAAIAPSTPTPTTPEPQPETPQTHDATR